MKKLLTLTLALSAIFPALAFAMDLGAAKQAGLVGETQQGFIAAVSPNPSAEVKALVAQTNDGRKAVYEDTAKTQGVPLSQVQTLAAEKLYGMASGQYVQVNGAWVKK